MALSCLVLIGHSLEVLVKGAYGDEWKPQLIITFSFADCWISERGVRSSTQPRHLKFMLNSVPPMYFTDDRSQVHTNIIAALQAAGADASLLDTNGNSAQDFDSQRSVEEVVGGASGGGRLEPPRTRPVVPPAGDGDEL